MPRPDAHFKKSNHTRFLGLLRCPHVSMLIRRDAPKGFPGRHEGRHAKQKHGRRGGRHEAKGRRGGRRVAHIYVNLSAITTDAARA